MHTPKHFSVTDNNELLAFIAKNAFGQLISTVDGRPVATHMPFLVSDDGCKLLGHFAKINPQHRELGNQEALVTFQGPHDYISPSWYSGPGVPTWNYQAVHVYGRCALITDPGQLKHIVDALTHKYESGFPNPWQPSYRDAMLNAIVGVEITISEIQGQYKLSQNRPAQDRRQVIDQLKAINANDLAAAMEKVALSEKMEP
ncbi:FMN-binding negative transcriptional regulator [Microbulbifer sp. ALW1]|uniref:FMN-binding negative transcriptional regulator n=1 Tax=Microbulbifer sp. (strain ALW1) TaxID=1516059 RepID=UPI001356CD6E|nr:FMN-binding negative transcriptional regulator [Microbulbifer sp. ALW1]